MQWLKWASELSTISYTIFFNKLVTKIKYIQFSREVVVVYTKVLDQTITTGTSFYFFIDFSGQDTGPRL